MPLGKAAGNARVTPRQPQFGRVVLVVGLGSSEALTVRIQALLGKIMNTLFIVCCLLVGYFDYLTLRN